MAIFRLFCSFLEGELYIRIKENTKIWKLECMDLFFT